MHRYPGQMHPITKPIILLGYILAVIWVLWSTFIAFTGGRLPILGWQLNGGVLWGLGFIACLWPVASIIAFLFFQALDALAWWLDEIVRSRFKK